MSDLLKKILNNDLLNEETRKDIEETFRKVLDEAKIEQEKRIQAELAERYEADKVKIAEAVEQFVLDRCSKELDELRESLKGMDIQRGQLAEQTIQVKEQAKDYVKKQLSILHQVVERALRHEVAELHEELQANRRAVLKQMAENKARSEVDREAFKRKGAKVLENIIKVRLEKEFGELKEDIKVAKENDFSRRVFEAFYGEFRRNFFNSRKEHKSLLDKLAEQEKNFKKQLGDAQKRIQETTRTAQEATKKAAQLQEGMVRNSKMSRLLNSIPQGQAREKMKLILEATQTAKLEETFKKYSNRILTETRRVNPEERIQKTVVELRTGNPAQAIMESQDDEEIIALRNRAGIRK